MLTTTITKKGKLFKNFHITKDVIREALDITAGWGVNRVRDLSPVKTGALKAGWYSRYQGEQLSIDNKVNYTKYQEKRFQMVGQTKPQLQRKFTETIELYLKLRLQ